MNIGLYAGAAALGVIERWQETISQNISNSGVPGYRAREVQVTGVQPKAMERAGQAGSVQIPVARIAINQNHGQIAVTGRDLDVAIQGKGFFEIEMEDGSRAFTRSGSLHLNTDRQLVDSRGRAILGDGGTPITLLSDEGPLTIARDGTLSQGESVIGRLVVHGFEDVSSLEAISGGLFRPKAGEAPVPQEGSSIIQGALESSNVEPVREMINLVAATRAYESVRKAMTARDEMLEKTLRSIS